MDSCISYRCQFGQIKFARWALQQRMSRELSCGKYPRFRGGLFMDCQNSGEITWMLNAYHRFLVARIFFFLYFKSTSLRRCFPLTSRGYWASLSPTLTADTIAVLTLGDLCSGNERWRGERAKGNRHSGTSRS